jgi:hypothetical protein
MKRIWRWIEMRSIDFAPYKFIENFIYDREPDNEAVWYLNISNA